MTGRERCDEILRIIDQVLLDCEPTAGTAAKAGRGQRVPRAAERLVASACGAPTSV